MKKRIISYIALFLSLVTVFMTYPFIAIAAKYDDSYFDPTNVIADKGSDNVYIVSEDESQRSENSKVFLMSDGSYSVAVYPFAVHYEEDGEMKEIDNTLISTEDGYATSAGDVTVSLPEAMDEGAVSYTNGEHSVTFSIETKNASKGQKKVKEKNSDKINKLSEGLAVAFMSDEEFEAAYGRRKSSLSMQAPT